MAWGYRIEGYRLESADEAFVLVDLSFYDDAVVSTKDGQPVIPFARVLKVSAGTPAGALDGMIREAAKHALSSKGTLADLETTLPTGKFVPL